MLLHHSGEEGDPQSIQAFLEANYPQIVGGASANVVQILVGHLAANGKMSMTGLEKTIGERVAEDIIDAEKAGITDPEQISTFLADLYTQMYGSQDVVKAVAGAGVATINPLYHAIVRSFYQAQATKYMMEGLRGVRPSCPFQGLIRKTAKRLVEVFVKR